MMPSFYQLVPPSRGVLFDSISFVLLATSKQQTNKNHTGTKIYISLGKHLFTNAFIQAILTEYLLCVRSCVLSTEEAEKENTIVSR